MYKQSIGMYTSPYLILQSKPQTTWLPQATTLPTPGLTLANQRPCSATDGASPRQKMLRIAALRPTSAADPKQRLA